MLSVKESTIEDRLCMLESKLRRRRIGTVVLGALVGATLLTGV